jgi:hypothetical protein
MPAKKISPPEFCACFAYDRGKCRALVVPRCPNAQGYNTCRFFKTREALIEQGKRCVRRLDRMGHPAAKDYSVAFTERRELV